MVSDIKLDGENVVIDGNVGVGVSPGARLDVGDRIRLRAGPSGTAGAWMYQSSKDRAFVGMATDTKVGMYGNSGAGWALHVDAVTGNVGIGLQTASAARRVHVEGSEIHSGGASGGLSFSDRARPAFVEAPTTGERWVWFASNGDAVLWSGGNKLRVSANGELFVNKIIAPTGKLIQIKGPNNIPGAIIPETIELVAELVALRAEVEALKAKVP